MSDYIKVNVNKGSGAQAGKGLQIKQHVSIIDVTDILSMGDRDGRNVLITDPFVMKSNKYGISLYLTQDTAELSSNSDGDTDNEGFTPSLKFKHPGNRQAVREFKSNWVDKKCILVLTHCETGVKDMIGDLCNPCKMQVNLSANKDATSNEFTFTQLMRGNDIAIFEGTVPLRKPVVVVSPSAGYLSLSAGEGEYQLSGGSLNIQSDPTTPPEGMIFTVLGTKSGVAPTISTASSLTDNMFLLKTGTSWTGSPGKQITFKTYRYSSSKAMFLEVSRIG